jgi:hypothetical protein
MWRRLIVVSVISGDVPRDGGARPPATWVPDLVGAAIVTGLMVLISSHLSRFVDDRELDALGYTLVVAGGASLALCRRWPRLILGIVVVVLGIYVARQYPNGPVFAAGWVALFVLSWRTDRRSAVVGAGVLCVVLGLVSVAVGRVHVGGNRGLTVEVCDDGTGRNGSSGTGMGIPGMRERAEMTGGRLEAHPRPEGGFVVRATWDGAA